jgi:hypothetical protein
MGRYGQGQVSSADLSNVSILLRNLLTELGGFRGAAINNWRRVAGGKQASGQVVDLRTPGNLAAGGKQSLGIGVDVINILRELNARISVLAERSGVSASQLGLAASLRDVFSNARAAGIDRKLVTAAIEEQLERAYRGK